MARNDEKLYTERDLAIARRGAFRDGVNYATARGVKEHPAPHGPCIFCDREAAERYPLPRVTRPRVVRDEWGIDWRIAPESLSSSRAIQRRNGDSWDFGLDTLCVTASRVALWADLLASPCEEVEDDS